jgi:hypothetical protein
VAFGQQTLAFGYHEDRTPTHGYEATREAAIAAFAKSQAGDHPRDGAVGGDPERARRDVSSGAMRTCSSETVAAARRRRRKQGAAVSR